MPHMVVFRTKEGKQGYHLADTLDDAVRFVEHLRNNEQVADSKVYRMHEVPIEFKVMYKVEVAGAAAPAEESDTSDSGRGAESAGAPTEVPAASTSRGEDRNNPVRAQSRSSMSGTAAAQGPVGETGGRFGLFSRA